MYMAIAIMMIWGLIGLVGCIAEEYEVYEVINPFILTFLVTSPCFPFIFHMCGLF